jgi:hypothetical protein
VTTKPVQIHSLCRVEDYQSGAQPLVALAPELRSAFFVPQRTRYVAHILITTTIMVVSAGVATAKGNTKAAAAVGPAPIPRSSFITNMDAQFRAIDADKDGSLTAAEIEKSQQATTDLRNAAKAQLLFGQLDVDKNGQLSPPEFARIPLPGMKPDAKPMISRLDSNKDGKVTLVEYRGGTLVNFDRLDADKDGIVSAREMKTGGIAR